MSECCSAGQIGDNLNADIGRKGVSMGLKPAKREIAAGGAILVLLIGVPLAAGWMLAFGDAPGNEDANRAFEIVCSVAGVLWAVWLFLARKEAAACALLVIQRQRFVLFLTMGGVIFSLLAKVGFESIAGGRVAYGVLALITLLLFVLTGWGLVFFGYLRDKGSPEKGQSDPGLSD